MSKYVALEDAKDAVMNTEAVFAVGMAEPYQKTIDVMKALDNLTTIDIVRCEDCKYWHEWENGTGSCHRRDIIWVGSDYDDYCSFAERKESDE